MTELRLPRQFNFVTRGTFDFEKALRVFDWNLTDQEVVISFDDCTVANFSTLGLLVMYCWYLYSNNCDVVISCSNFYENAAFRAWKRLRADKFVDVLNGKETFTQKDMGGMYAVKSHDDTKAILGNVRYFTSQYNTDYENLISFVVSEILYNTLEHGSSIYYSDEIERQMPSVIQFSYYEKQNELQFIVCDLGIGIKSHLEQAYPPFENDQEAIFYSIKPKVSGTFGQSKPYAGKNNAGMGLYISTNILKRLKADIHLVSGGGLIHISPTDVTSKQLSHPWLGTFAHFKVNLSRESILDYQQIMGDLREAARKEIDLVDKKKAENEMVISIYTYFGRYADNKAAAISVRDRAIIPAINQGKTLIFDFNGIKSSPHSFLNALLATPAKILGIQAYKKLKFINFNPEIRETIDYIIDENT